MKYQTITVRAYAMFADYESQRGCVVEFTFDTVKEARTRARYYLSEDYRRSSEAADRLNYAQVIADGEILHDFFNR